MDRTPELPAERRPMGIVMVSIGLVFVVAAVGMMFTLRTAPLDGAALLAERFEYETAPWGFEPTEALRLQQGEEMVVLADPDYEPPAVDDSQPERESAEGERSGGGGPPGGDRRGRGRGRRGGGSVGSVDSGAGWDKLADGEAGTRPYEVAFVWYPLRMAEDLLKRQFIQVNFSDTRSVDWGGGSVVVDSGELDWFGYAARYVRERHFKWQAGEQTYHDAMRVNLTIGNRCCVAYMRWRDGAVGDKQVVEELLRSFGPKLATDS